MFNRVCSCPLFLFKCSKEAEISATNNLLVLPFKAVPSIHSIIIQTSCVALACQDSVLPPQRGVWWKTQDTSTLSDFNDVTESLEGQQHFHSFLFKPQGLVTGTAGQVNIECK